MSLFHQRQSFTDFNQPYFHTYTIEGFKTLLDNDQLKLIVIHALKYLVDNKMVEIYGYVLMPNHIHLLWTILSKTSKENPGNSVVKFTAHEFKNYLIRFNVNELEKYKSNKNDRHYQFWKRDPLAVKIDGDDILTQKLTYIHNNPLSGKWNLCQYPEDYRWSSAKFYLTGDDEFGILTHYKDDT